MEKACQVCGSTVMLEEHHTIPRYLGGHNSKLVTLCKECHNIIHKIAFKIIHRKTLDADKIRLEYLSYKPHINRQLFNELISLLVKVHESLKSQQKITRSELNISVKLPLEVYLAVREQARSEGSLATFITNAIVYYLKYKGWKIP